MSVQANRVKMEWQRGTNWNDKARMTNDEQSPNGRSTKKTQMPAAFCHSAFGFRHWNDKRRPTKHVDAHRRRNQIPSRSILLRFELGEFFFGVSDVGFLSDTELKKLLLAA
jgi:hypothetical protein